MLAQFLSLWGLGGEGGGGRVIQPWSFFIQQHEAARVSAGQACKMQKRKPASEQASTGTSTGPGLPVGCSRGTQAQWC